MGNTFSRVPLEMLHEKRGVDLKLYLFLRVEFLEPDLFSWIILKWSYKGWNRAVQTNP